MLQDNNKTLIVDVFDAFFRKNGKVVFYSENLTSSNLTNKIDQAEVKNGKGNKLFAMLNKSKSASIELNSNVFSFATVAMQTGQDIVTGKGIAFKAVEKLKVTTAGEVDLTETPLFPIEIQVMDIKTGKEIAGSVVGKKFTATVATDLPLDAIVKVMPYKFETPATASTLTVDTESFAEGGELVLTTYERNADNKIIADVQIICQHAMPDGSWELATQSEVQPKDMKITMNILADEEGNYYKIVRIPR